MNHDAPDGTRADDARVPVVHAVRLGDDVFIVQAGGEVSLVDRETLLMLLKQLFNKEKPYD